jgi:hypothetical protein
MHCVMVPHRQVLKYLTYKGALCCNYLMAQFIIIIIIIIVLNSLLELYCFRTMFYTSILFYLQ